MSRRVRVLSIFAVLSSSSCGFIGIDLLDGSHGALKDAGPQTPEGGSTTGPDGSFVEEGGTPGDASQAVDGGEPRDGSGPGEASVADAATSDASSAVACDTSGTYAVKISIAVSWPTGIVSGGAGTSVFWGRFTGTQSGNALVGTLQPCGFTLPDFSLNPLVASELYQLVLPDTLFDRVPPYIAAVPVSFSSPGGFAVGSPFSMPAVAIQVGANLTTPATDPWPAVDTLPTVDTDADGKVGVTASYTSGGGYSYPPANMTGTARTDHAYTGTRFAFSGTGNNTSCSEFIGDLSFTAFDTHIVGCRVAGGGDCTTAERDQVDSSRPLFAPTSATLRSIEVPASSTCAAVRAALP